MVVADDHILFRVRAGVRVLGDVLGGFEAVGDVAEADSPT